MLGGYAVWGAGRGDGRARAWGHSAHGAGAGAALGRCLRCWWIDGRKQFGVLMQVLFWGAVWSAVCGVGDVGPRLPAGARGHAVWGGGASAVLGCCFGLLFEVLLTARARISEKTQSHSGSNF